MPSILGDIELMPNIAEMTIQSAVFNKSKFRPDINFAAQLNQAAGNLFDGEPMVLPLPDDAPLDIPLIILQNSNRSYKLTIAPSRSDFFYIHKASSESPVNIDEIYQDYKNIFNKILPLIAEKFNINRLGKVVRFLFELESSSITQLTNKYLKNALVKSPWEIQIIVLEKTSINKFDVNKWIKLKSLRKKSDPKNDKNILLELDINTLEERSYELSLHDIHLFFDNAMSISIAESHNLFIGD